VKGLEEGFEGDRVGWGGYLGLLSLLASELWLLSIFLLDFIYTLMPDSTKFIGVPSSFLD
jgi:hypothetical protein